MAGHAPGVSSSGGRWGAWLSRASDLRLSIYMLLAAGVVACGIYLLNRQFPV